MAPSAIGHLVISGTRFWVRIPVFRVLCPEVAAAATLRLPLGLFLGARCSGYHLHSFLGARCSGAYHHAPFLGVPALTGRSGVSVAGAAISAPRRAPAEGAPDEAAFTPKKMAVCGGTAASRTTSPSLRRVATVRGAASESFTASSARFRRRVDDCRGRMRWSACPARRL